MARRVVVGWDGSTAAATAVDWGIRHCPDAESVEIVEVQGGRTKRAPHLDIEEGAEAARAAHPGVDVRATVERGSPVEVLADRSTPSTVVVLGGRGHEETRLAHRTSIAYRVVLEAKGPVAVVPQAYRGGHGVVVGVTGPADAPCVALAAAGEAARRRQKLIAVHVARAPFGVAALPGDHANQEHDEQELDRMVQQVLAPVAEAYPNLTVVRRIVRGRPSDVLLDLSRSAMLVVLGRDAPPANRRPITQSSMLLSRSPVMVVPPESVVA